MNRYFGAAIAIAAMLVACKPSPDEITLYATSSPERVQAPPTQMVEGDAIVIDAFAHDGEEKTELCVTATSSSPEALSIQTVVGNCRQFLVSALSPGRVSLSFSARDTVEEISIDVVAPSAP